MSDTDTDPDADTGDSTDQTTNQSSAPPPTPQRMPPPSSYGRPMQTGYIRDMGPVGQPPPTDPTDVPQIPFGYRRMEPSGVGPFNPYIPTGQNPALRRSPSEAGTDDWVMRGINDGATDGMHVPREQDLAPIYHHVTMGLGQWAPPMIAMPAIAGGRFYGTAMQMYAKNMVQQANMNRQNAEASYKITQLRLKEYTQKIGNIYAAYGPSEKDPKSSDRWHQELYELAGEYGDHKLQQMLANGEYDAVDRLVAHLDTNLQDLNKALKTQELGIKTEERKAKEEKNRRDAQEESEWLGTKPSEATSDTEASPAPTGAPAAGATETAPPSGVPSSTSKKVDTGADTGGYSVPLAPSNKINEAAQALQMGEKPLLPKNEKIRGAAERQKEALDSYMNKLIDDKNLSGEDTLTKAAAVNPKIGRLVNDLRDGTTELTPSASDKPAEKIASAILKKIDPEWHRTTQKNKDRSDYLAMSAEVSPLRGALLAQEKTRTAIRNTVTKNANDFETLVKLGERLKQKGVETGVPLTDGYMRELRRRFLGDPDVAAFDAQLLTVRSDVGRILASGGQAGSGAVYPQSAQKEMREFFDLGLSMPQLKAMIGVIKNDYANKLPPISAGINDLNMRIAHITKTQPPQAVSDQDIINQLSADETKQIGGKTYYRRGDDWFDE